MKVKSLVGSDIEECLSAAMHTTVAALQAQKYLTAEQAKYFLDNHVCMLAEPSKRWARIRKFLGVTNDDEVPLVVCQVIKSCE